MVFGNIPLDEKVINKEVVIVGGGLAGLTTAYLLAPTFHVAVLEATNAPGGQARAFRIGGTSVEHGSHVFFKYYKNSLGLLAEVGPPRHLVQIPGWTIVNGEGQQVILEQSGRLPGLLSLIPSLMKIPWFSGSDRMRAMAASYRLIKAPVRRWPEADAMTALELGTQYGYSITGAETWNSASLGLTDSFVDELSGAIFAGMHKVLVGEKRGLSYLIPDMNLSELFAVPLSQAVEKRGAAVRLGYRVTGLELLDGSPDEPGCHVRFAASEGSGSIDAHYTIVAVQPQDAAKLATWTGAAWTGLHRATPIITITLGLSGEVSATRDGREYGLSRKDWIFSVITDLSKFWPEFAGNKTVLRVEVGHADLLPGGANIPDDKLISLVKRDLDRLWPECAALKVEFAKKIVSRSNVYVSWKRGCVMKKPNIAAITRGNKSLEKDDRDLGHHVYLAGDWTSKGTIGMEAAVNSAFEAANFVRASVGLPSLPFRDVPIK
jgi:uncharacterized protein with NAD-binding domain and iron-sulfur cluster